MASDKENKKKWRVRSYADSSGNVTAQSFEDTLNEMEDAGYDVFRMHEEDKVIVGKVNGSPPNLSLHVGSMDSTIGSLIQGILGRNNEEKPSDDSDGLGSVMSVEVKGGVSTYKFLSCIRLAMGQAVTDEQRRKLIGEAAKHIFDKSARGEIEASREDISRMLEVHTKEKGTCEPNCIINGGFKVAIEVLTERLAAAPAAN